MGIGASIFLIAAGAILAFALDVHVGWLDLHAVGWILMAAGVIGIIMTTLIWGRRNRTIVTGTAVPPAQYTRVEERDDVTPPLP